ncbi:MAG TPA: isopentenyl-diphosphate Delta-isomerase [Solirubrobacteraceae bacterium]
MTVEAGRTGLARTAEQELVVLCDERGRPTGSAEKSSTHHADTPLHLAFSCYIFDDRGRFLTSRRALTKKVWPGVWSNSACGHPMPGESFEEAIVRRVGYELGMTVRDVEVVLPQHLYRAPPFAGIVEYEFCPVFVARQRSAPEPNPIEVAACAWMQWQEFVRRAREDVHDVWSWWCKDQLRELHGRALIERYSRPE